MLLKKSEAFFKEAQKKYQISNKDMYSFKLVAQNFINYLNNDNVIWPTYNIQKYYELYATNEEKKYYQTKMHIFFIQLKAILNTSKNINILINYYHLNSRKIFNLLKLYNQDSNLLKEYMSLFKDYYEECNKVLWDKTKITLIALKYNLSYDEFRYLALNYAKIFNLPINMTNENSIPIYKAKYNKDQYFHSKDYVILNRIMLNDDVKIYAPLFYENNIQKGSIIRFCYVYHYELTKEEQRTLEKIILTKKEKATKYYNEIYLQNLYQEYIASNLDINTFINSKQIKKNSLTVAVKSIDDSTLKNNWTILLDEYDLMRKNYYNNTLKQENATKNSQKVKYYQEIVSYLKEGINCNGRTRAFDLLDFFLMYKDLKVCLRHQIREISLEDNHLLDTFFKPINYGGRFNKDILLNSQIVISTSYDQDGNLIPNSGYYVTKEEIELIINYLDANNIPHYNILFDTALKRYLNGSLVIEKTLQPQLN